MGTIMKNGVCYGSYLERDLANPSGIDLSSVAPDYDSTKAYSVNDYCIYGNKLYRCTEDTTAGAFNASKWSKEPISSMLTYLKNELSS